MGSWFSLVPHLSHSVLLLLDYLFYYVLFISLCASLTRLWLLPVCCCEKGWSSRWKAADASFFEPQEQGTRISSYLLSVIIPKAWYIRGSQQFLHWINDWATPYASDASVHIGTHTHTCSSCSSVCRWENPISRTSSLRILTCTQSHLEEGRLEVSEGQGEPSF